MIAESIVDDRAIAVQNARFRQDFITELPMDLYIPPDALLVFLDAFEGPLDLLLYIIKKHNMDILDIPIAEITKQYMKYVDVMRELRLELAGEYLVMAATLAEIKSRMLLPKTESSEEDVNDPRADLIKRLQEYERFKAAAEQIDQVPRLERDIFLLQATATNLEQAKPLPDVGLHELLSVMKQLLQQADLQENHHIQQESLSIREKMTSILEKIQQYSFIDFSQCFTLKEGRRGVVACFIAILELLKQGMIDIIQHSIFAPIYIKAVNNE